MGGADRAPARDRVLGGAGTEQQADRATDGDQPGNREDAPAPHLRARRRAWTGGPAGRAPSRQWRRACVADHALTLRRRTLSVEAAHYAAETSRRGCVYAAETSRNSQPLPASSRSRCLNTLPGSEVVT